MSASSRLSGDDRLLVRVEATDAELAPGAWLLHGARTMTPGHLARAYRRHDLADQPHGQPGAGELRVPGHPLGLGRCRTSSRCWRRSGFSAIRHRLHFQTLLALPLLAGTMALVAAGFSMRPTRRGGVAQMIASGVAAGFMLFVESKVTEEFGQSGSLPAVLAAWAPAFAGLLLAVSLLLHLEDG